MTTAKQRIAASPYPFAKLAPPDENGAMQSFWVADMRLPDACTLCANAMRLIVGQSFVAREEHGGVRIWRTM